MAQINPTLGAFKENAQKIIDQSLVAYKKGCELVVFPECALFGYYPGDLLERDSIVKEQIKYIARIEKKIPKGLTILYGAITENKKKFGKKYFNSAILVKGGSRSKFFNKTLLPTYDIFDEGRHIEPGTMEKNFFKLKGKKFLVTICEDIWAWPEGHSGDRTPYSTNPLKALKKEKPDFVINLSASPYTRNKLKRRESVIKKTSDYFKAPLLYTNIIGAHDEVIFDGQSMIFSKGKVVSRADAFKEDLHVFDCTQRQNKIHKQDHKSQQLLDALVLGIKDYLFKTGLKKVHFGLSGGIDSAVVAFLAVEALGPENVTAIAMPGPYSSDLSFNMAKELADNLGIEFLSAKILKPYESVVGVLEESFGSSNFGLMHENIQARLRGLYLMAFSNKHNSMLLNTSNKSELACGYSTLYGDQCGGLSPMGDLLKREVYELANYYNKLNPGCIPQDIITRPPSAELAPNQKDEDSLPEYDKLDNAVSKLVTQSKAPRGDIEKWALKALMRSEFKRWQAPPVLKVTSHAFGMGRRMPIAHKAIY